jgi:hypothetical protein
MNNSKNKSHRQKIMVFRNSNSMDIVESEISKVYFNLILISFEDFKKIVLEKYDMISEKLRETTKYRDPSRLIPIIIYIYFHLRGGRINKSQLLSVSQLSSADFNDFFMQFTNYLKRMIKKQRLRKL